MWAGEIWDTEHREDDKVMMGSIARGDGGREEGGLINVKWNVWEGWERR